jgi:hypothetical protein
MVVKTARVLPIRKPPIREKGTSGKQDKVTVILGMK